MGSNSEQQYVIIDRQRIYFFKWLRFLCTVFDWEYQNKSTWQKKAQAEAVRASGRPLHPMATSAMYAAMRPADFRKAMTLAGHSARTGNGPLKTTQSQAKATRVTGKLVPQKEADSKRWSIGKELVCIEYHPVIFARLDFQ